MVDRSGLRPELREMLEALDELPPVDIFTVAPTEERVASEARLRDLWGPKEHVERVEDLTYRSEGHELAARIYRPRDPSAGTILFIHGGGWVVGSIETHDGSARALANASRYNVVSISYRKGPEHPFPAAVADVLSALRWLTSAGGVGLGLDTSRIVVVGESAGGTLAAGLSRLARDNDIPLTGVALVYPPTDARMTSRSYSSFAEGFYLSARAMAWFYHHYLPANQQHHPDASPVLTDDLSGLPPTLVVTAEFDPLRDEGRAYAARLIEAGNDVSFREIRGAIHGIWVMNGKTGAAREIICTVADWTRQTLTV
jgi:acetyl esterase